MKNVLCDCGEKIVSATFTTATHLDGLKVIAIDGEDKTRYEH